MRVPDVVDLAQDLESGAFMQLTRGSQCHQDSRSAAKTRSKPSRQAPQGQARRRPAQVQAAKHASQGSRPQSRLCKALIDCITPLGAHCGVHAQAHQQGLLPVGSCVFGRFQASARAFQAPGAATPGAATSSTAGQGNTAHQNSSAPEPHHERRAREQFGAPEPATALHT